MNMLLNLQSPVTTAHRAKLAYIYVRQSTAGQVRQHQESTELQIAVAKHFPSSNACARGRASLPSNGVISMG